MSADAAAAEREPRPQGRFGSRRRAAQPLRADALPRLVPGLSLPHYDRSALRPSVVHLGVGSFHRSHQAVHFDELARQGRRGWGVVGVGLRRSAMRDALAAQDGLYTVVTRGPDGDAARVVGVMPAYLFAPEQPEAVLAALASPDTAVVTMTVTGDGYGCAAGEPQEAPGPSATAVEHLVAALDRRRHRGLEPFTVVSCDNLPSNGEVVRAAVLAQAGRRDERLAAWIAARVSFPNGMVDRITPRTTALDRERLARDFGVLDRWPVVTEPFSQWILEDRFCGRRPPLQDTGVQLVGDVRPYALMKTRLLNAGHFAIGHLGGLAGLRRADEVVRDPVLHGYLTGMMDREVTPLLPPVPGVHLGRYKASVVERLANPRLADDLGRLRRAGSSKLAAHVVPSIAEARRRGGPHGLLTLAVAGWARTLRGTDEAGARLALDDPLAARLRALARRGGDDPRPLLAEDALFGELGRDERFAREVGDAMAALGRHGVRGALARAVDGDREPVA